jgi:toxin-antitoxin system PIN domain toxin
MKSLDTNILLYALNRDCEEHARATALVEAALAEPERWIIADQVYFELYRLVRNPAVLGSPLSASEADKTVSWYRSRSGWLRCSYEISMMNQVSHFWSSEAFQPRNTFDLVLAVTLAKNGVREFYTRNAGDFDQLGLFDVRNPIDG